MSKLDKRAISILVIATFLLSMIPLASAAGFAITGVNPSVDVDYGDILAVIGEGVMGGSEVSIFWDYAYGDYAILLNTTEGNPNGSFDCNIKVPSDTVGEHFIWATLAATGETVMFPAPIMMIPKIKPSPSSGLPGDKVTVNGYGFSAETKIDIIMEEYGTSTEVIGTGVTGQQTFTGTLTNLPVGTSSLSITDGTQTVADNGVGGLAGAGTGSINYVTGVYSVTFTNPPVAGTSITAVYFWAGTFTIQAIDTFETDELGSFTKDFNVPSLLYGDYHITANTTLAPISEIFIIGASITVTPEEGPTGTVVSVSGRGWTIGNTITFRKKGTTMPIEVVSGTEVKVVSGGKFSANVVIPELGTEGDYDIEAVETGPGAKAPSSDSFELTGLPEVVVSPTYGSPGATITVTGSNFTQIAGTEVAIELWGKSPDPVIRIAELVIAETKSDGTFEETFMSPAVAFVGYDVTADDTYLISAKDAFKVGLIALIINPVYGEAGTKISITGIGFTPGVYNVTFGTKVYEEYGAGVTGGEAISDIFYVPNVELGTYDLTITDEDENELTVMFSVTDVTEVVLDPAKAPNDYNMTVKGYNFADKEVEEVDFVLYNATEYWDMDVWQDRLGTDPVKTDDDGNFTAWWMVFPEADLSLGDYTINVTGYDDFFLQLPFSVIEARVDVAPRKALFDRGDTIQFNVKNDFKFVDSYMKIWDPYDNLYWRTEDFTAWLKVGDIYTVPYYLQTSGMNPMTLSQDAPLGTWFYVFYEEGTTQLTNGTFEVGPSSAAQVDQKLTEIWDSMEGITEDIDSITSEIEDEIDALSGEMDDVVSDVQGMIDDITSDLAGELAGVAADTEAAVGELEDSIGDIAAAQNALADEVGDISQDTAAARQAAEDAQEGTQGLTTIVYGAIFCSLIAALAAVVSLMQISKKIA